MTLAATRIVAATVGGSVTALVLGRPFAAGVLAVCALFLWWVATAPLHDQREALDEWKDQQ